MFQIQYAINLAISGAQCRLSKFRKTIFEAIKLLLVYYLHHELNACITSMRWGDLNRWNWNVLLKCSKITHNPHRRTSAKLPVDLYWSRYSGMNIYFQRTFSAPSRKFLRLCVCFTDTNKNNNTNSDSIAITVCMFVPAAFTFITVINIIYHVTIGACSRLHNFQCQHCVISLRIQLT